MKPQLSSSSRLLDRLSHSLLPPQRSRPTSTRIPSHSTSPFSQEYHTPRRSLHDSPSLKESSAQTISTSDSLTSTSIPTQDVPNVCSSPNPLSLLSFTSLLRSYAITSLSTNPLLLRPAMVVLTHIAHSSSPVFSPDKNPLIHAILKKTIYEQYCAGENTREVRQTISRLKEMGFRGVILGYGREVAMDEGAVKEMGTGRGGILGGEERKVTGGVQAGSEELEAWKKGSLDTVECATEGDMVGLK